MVESPVGQIGTNRLVFADLPANVFAERSVTKLAGAQSLARPCTRPIAQTLFLGLTTAKQAGTKIGLWGNTQ